MPQKGVKALLFLLLPEHADGKTSWIIPVCSHEVAAEIGFSVYPPCDEDSSDCSSSSSSSMDSETETSHGSTPDHGREDDGRAGRSEAPFPPYLSCRGCGQLRDDHSVDLAAAPYCLRCCKASREHKSGDFAFGMQAHSPLDNVADGEDKNKLHSCHLCGFSSRYANHVKRHMKTHNGEKPFNCPVCAYASAQLVNLQRHLRIHTGEKPYKCESCAFACSSLGNLKRHQRMHMPVGAGPEPLQQPAAGHAGLKRGGRRASEDDDEAAKEVAAASAHLTLAAQNADYLSAFESLKGASPQSAPAPGAAPCHPPSNGPGAGASRTPPSSSLFPFTCRLCGAVLEDEDGSSAQICAKCTLEMLTKDSSSSPGSPGERGDKVYTCAACPFLTHYPNHLARHMKTHSGEKPYKCPQCDYASAHFDNLKRHHRVHTGEKPYKCHLCDYACGNLANLKRHQRVHSGAKPFACAVCNYSCNQSMNLKRHMLRHTGEKPYKCQECGYTTGHWDNYKRHQKKHGHATDGWVKMPPAALGRNQDDKGGARGGHRKEAAAAAAAAPEVAYMAREGAQTMQHPNWKLEMV
ncbi:zinc finger protein 513a isoform X2 [Hippocampus zosterae]|uniref:zinc finger protein 513a isoform X2 n=1 Tax=Hippocampus zosterae TaxID=109293 RepID=UPI00223D5014|nr:zinc finger protein 513a isoform X2 [Hippocampus zosterae]XP_051908768.1 zinc finger protein 513a isoform X2 [Hippocampus zosterae]